MQPDFQPEAFIEAIAELKHAQSVLNSAAEELKRARNVHTDCVNRLNRAQKQFDLLSADVRKAAPYETDWAREAAKKVKFL